MQPTETIWFNGKLVPWDQAQTHVLSHAIHYGSSIFEGIRSYQTATGIAIFRLQDHIKRLFDSAKIYRMPLDYSQQQIVRACKELLSANQLTNAYIRPFAFFGYGSIGVSPKQCPLEVSIAAFEWGAYLGEDSIEQGVDTAVSSWNRVAPNTLPSAAKAGGNYLSSQLIVEEYQRHGYQEAIALDARGFVSEGSGQNIFMVKDNKLITPPSTAAILTGLTRDSVFKLAQTMDLTVQEADISRESLYLADELFFTGTATEIVPIRSVDGLTIGSGRAGNITKQLQQAFFGLFSGETEDQWGWLDYL
ncbi:branched-chain amino acid transaminase [Kangiella sp. TOML190]|uniref:branched-chain amino acid transaminase n=1 Tax=Kangiella sp. TOML190 TaxID=2931351 RepID=UPI00203B768A|nr:branched-chain amino acid transaminase [Kangiella sp. TOML190]